jgi:CheY-like chemotaxis protein
MARLKLEQVNSMAGAQKVLLLDDDADLLAIYKEILGRLPSQPEVHTATSGARAIAILESEPFSLLVSDLNMPKMDGLQVLTIVRRKFPHLRTAVLSSVVDEQFRARAYSMGIDLFLEKPSNGKEITFFLDCIESLLGREQESGFRGIQSKSLVDLIQLECLSQSSSCLKMTNGPIEGKIWIQNGEIIDAEAADLRSEKAFYKILSWKTGNFEILPLGIGSERTIQTSHQGLLLEFAQAQDEAIEAEAVKSRPSETVGEEVVPESNPLSELASFNGVEFVLVVPDQIQQTRESWGAENADQISQWVRETVRGFESLGEALKAGALQELEGLGPRHHIGITPRNQVNLCVGFHRSLSLKIVRETLKKIVEKWAS